MAKYSWSRRRFLGAGAVWFGVRRKPISAQRSEPDGNRVAVICDIHGNLPALEAVLEDVRRAGVDEVIVAGDVFPGPMPFEVLARLDTSNVPVSFIKGNGDRVVLAAKDGGDISEVPAAYQDVILWAAAALTDDGYKIISRWPPTMRTKVRGLGDVLVCHATPRNDTEIFTRVTEETRLLPIFRDIGVPLVVCGHTHMQFDRLVGLTRIVNAGSVGMPFGERAAYWLLLGPDVELRKTKYDLSAAAAVVRATEYPRAEEFATQSILQPPTEEQMLAAYRRVELR